MKRRRNDRVHAKLVNENGHHVLIRQASVATKLLAQERTVAELTAEVGRLDARAERAEQELARLNGCRWVRVGNWVARLFGREHRKGGAHAAGGPA